MRALDTPEGIAFSCPEHSNELARTKSLPRVSDIRTASRHRPSGGAIYYMEFSRNLGYKTFKAKFYYLFTILVLIVWTRDDVRVIIIT